MQTVANLAARYGSPQAPRAISADDPHSIPSHAGYPGFSLHRIIRTIVKTKYTARLMPAGRNQALQFQWAVRKGRRRWQGQPPSRSHAMGPDCRGSSPHDFALSCRGQRRGTVHGAGNTGRPHSQLTGGEEQYGAQGAPATRTLREKSWESIATCSPGITIS